MSSLSTSLNQLLAANYAFIKPPAAQNANPQTTNFDRDLLANLKPGSTVTARTDYTVAANGSLIPKSTAITIGNASGADALDPKNGKPGLGTYVAPQIDARPLRFADLTRPRANLNPSDEALLFDADSIEGGDGQPARRFFDEQGAEDENGDAVQVEILSPDVADRELPALASQRQARVSNLYARNNDIIYNVEPQIAFAA